MSIMIRELPVGGGVVPMSSTGTNSTSELHESSQGLKNRLHIRLDVASTSGPDALIRCLPSCTLLILCAETKDSLKTLQFWEFLAGFSFRCLPPRSTL